MDGLWPRQTQAKIWEKGWFVGPGGRVQPREDRKSTVSCLQPATVGEKQL